jgi:GGDEF domain-containing protein
MNRDSSALTERERLGRLLDDLEFHRSIDVEYRLERAYRAEADARAAGLPDLRMRARLVQADMLQRSGQSTAAATIAAEVNRWAREHGPQTLLARSHLILAAIFENVGDSAACLDHALRALDLLADDAPPRTRGNFIARLGDAFTLAGSFDSARQRYRDAQKIFEAIGDVERQLNVLNNRAYSEAMAQNMEQARLAADQLRALAREADFELNPAFLDTLARVHIGLGEFAEAEADIIAALETLGRKGDVQAVTPAELTLTLAEAQRRQGRLEDAQRTLAQCREISNERILVGIEVEVLREQAELDAAAGRFERAYEMFKVYHERALSLSSTQREAAARTRQALFETAEARQEAQRYWRQARTDELTKLPNRRFVDEELPVRLREVAGGASIVAAIVDADHFKRINDTFSHDVGDRVIRELARLLQTVVAARDLDVAENGIPQPEGAPDSEGGAEREDEAEGVATIAEAGAQFVGRLGGEEFLVVLPGRDPASAADLLEELRAAVHDHDWRSLIQDLPMTVSVGAAAALPHDSQSDLLARADRCLYAAKRAGRNRVVVDFGTAS